MVFLSIAVSIQRLHCEKDLKFFIACHLPLPREGRSRHPVDFECILSPWAALSPYFFNIGQSIQRTPEIRLPLSRVGNIPSFFVFAGVQSPSLKQSCIRVHIPAVPTAMFSRHSKILSFKSSHLKPYLPSLMFCTSQSRNRSFFR